MSSSWLRGRVADIRRNNQEYFTGTMFMQKLHLFLGQHYGYGLINSSDILMAGGCFPSWILENTAKDIDIWINAPMIKSVDDSFDMAEQLGKYLGVEMILKSNIGFYRGIGEINAVWGCVWQGIEFDVIFHNQGSNPEYFFDCDINKMAVECNDNRIRNVDNAIRCFINKELFIEKHVDETDARHQNRVTKMVKKFAKHNFKVYDKDYFERDEYGNAVGNTAPDFLDF